MRLALCGLGGAGLRAHLPALQRATAGTTDAVVAICDRDPAGLEAGLQQLPEAQSFTDLEAMLRAVRPDLLVVATPPSVHLPAIRAGLAAGCHVVCEKPLGLTRDELEELRALSNGHPGLVLATVLQYEHAPAWQQLARRMREALDLGDPLRVRMVVERPGTDPLSAGGWRSQPGLEGGILGDHAVHQLGLLQAVAPHATVRSCRRRGQPGRESAEIELELAPGTATASITVTYDGSRRHNGIRVDHGRRPVLRWYDELLAIGWRPSAVGSLSDRLFVNNLYEPWYRSLLEALPDPARRAARTAQTLQVAALLQAAIEQAAAPATVAQEVPRPSVAGATLPAIADHGARSPVPASDGPFAALARVVLLAFADLGVYLPSHRDRLMEKARALEPLDPGELEAFLDLCVAAGLLAPGQGGDLRLSALQAQRLARSLDHGGAPVPDAQAQLWEARLAAAPQPS